MNIPKQSTFYTLMIQTDYPGYATMYTTRENRGLPGIHCDVCGAQYGGCDRGPFVVPKEVMEILKNEPYNVPRKRYLEIIEKIKEAMKSKYPDLVYRPGMALGQLQIELTGNRVASFMDNVSSRVVREDVLGVLLDEGITGFEYYPVEIVKIRRWSKKLPREKPKLFELKIVGKSDLKREESGVFLESSCDVCGHLAHTPPTRFVHDESKWDGSDIFEFPTVKYIIVTEKFKEVCEKHKFNNCKFIELEKVKLLNFLRLVK